MTLPLTLAQVATGLGLPSSVITTLAKYGIAGTSLNLSVIAGPDENVTKTSAQAWGLGLGVDLSGSLGFNLLGLVGATVDGAHRYRRRQPRQRPRPAPRLHRLHHRRGRRRRIRQAVPPALV